MKLLPYTHSAIKKVAAFLSQGNIVAHPADTCFGLAGDLMNPDAFKKFKNQRPRCPQTDEHHAARYPIASLGSVR
ncbi:hypothetical protein IPJ72_04860 [Candidatus Peregrinibacteria bacterium]|nr:MAG: hypothetical protein IPJ72_04860 [Candidatus Peregrinibacteria bacterium]